jgi:hypothetical protein
LKRFQFVFDVAILGVAGFTIGSPENENDIVTCFGRNICETAFPGQPIWKALGNRFARHTSTVTHRLKETLCGSECFLCSPSVVTEAQDIGRATVLAEETVRVGETVRVKRVTVPEELVSVKCKCRLLKKVFQVIVICCSLK